MKPETPLAPGIWRLTSNLEDEPPYQGRWPIPHGLALHAYLVRGERSVVIDPYHEGEFDADAVEEDLQALGLGWKDLDAVAFTGDDPGLPWPVPVLPHVQGTSHDLGGKTLRFEGGAVFEAATGVLFSGASWAGFGAVDETVLSTEANGNEAKFFEDEALRWWLDHPSRPDCPAGTTLIAPAHGLLWPNPAAVVERSRVWSTWNSAAEDEIALVWPAGAEHDARAYDLMAALAVPGYDLTVFRVPDDEASFVRAGLWRANYVVLGPGVDRAPLAGLRRVVWDNPATPKPDEVAAFLARRPA